MREVFARQSVELNVIWEKTSLPAKCTIYISYMYICSLLYQSKGIYLFIWQICQQKQRTIGRDIHYHIEHTISQLSSLSKLSMVRHLRRIASVEMKILRMRGLCKIIWTGRRTDKYSLWTICRTSCNYISVENKGIFYLRTYLYHRFV